MGVPDWACDLVPGCWYKLSGDSPDLGLAPTVPGTRYLAEGDPAADARLNPDHSITTRLRRLLGRTVRAPWSGRCNFPAITEAWNGAVYASHCGDSGSMVVFGGGHNDYFGSDVHTFDLANREWRRVSDGYVMGDSRDYGAGAVYPDAEYPDGSPLPPHTYGYVQYDKAGNDLLLFKGQRELGEHVQPLAIPHIFNLTVGKWRRGPCHPTAYLGAGGWSAWDDKRRVLWGNSGDGSDCFLGFSPDGKNKDGTYGHWGECFGGKLPGRADHCCMTYDPASDRLIVVDHRNNRLLRLDPGHPVRNPDAVTASDGPQLAPFAALEYSPQLDSLVYYSATDGARLWCLRRESMAWADCHWQSLMSAKNQLNPVNDAAQRTQYAFHRDHTFGRFRLASYRQMDLAVLVRHVDTPVYVMRLGR